MAMMQSEITEVRGAAERMRRYRERRRQGVVCIARVPIYALDAEILVARNRLKSDDQNNVGKIAEAIEALVDDFTEGVVSSQDNLS